jgi:hypothetical protein
MQVLRSSARRNAPSFVIKEQNGNRFSGTSTAGTLTEALIGAISPDNKSGVVLDDDGEYLFTIRESDTLDACYRHRTSASRVVSCYAGKGRSDPP